MPNNRKLLEIVEQTSRPRSSQREEEERIDPSRNTFEWRVFPVEKTKPATFSTGFR
jgi:hypothetical protein